MDVERMLAENGAARTAAAAWNRGGAGAVAINVISL
jgi:hypothetical protein